MANVNKRLRYISIPVVVGSVINILMFNSVINITMPMPSGDRIQISDFVLLVIYIVYVFIICSFDTHGNYSTAVKIGAFSGNLTTLVVKQSLNAIAKNKYQHSYNGVTEVKLLLVLGILLPHIIYFFKATRINKQISEREKIAEKQRQEQERLERELWEKNITMQIDNAFLHAPDRVLNTINKILEDSKSNSEQYNFIKQHMIPRSNEIYEISVEKLTTGNFSDAITGLRILTLLHPNEQKYQTALSRLSDKKTIINIMEKKGLPESSQIFKNNYAKILASKV